MNFKFKKIFIFILIFIYSIQTIDTFGLTSTPSEVHPGPGNFSLFNVGITGDSYSELLSNCLKNNIAYGRSYY